ncbi:MAG: adenylate kinase [Clostridia bacterium]|nr:adenylate kinase [Clostridia bacterium]
MNIILLGAPGAGKGTQATRIQENYKVKHISTGDIFRYNIKQQTEIGVLAQSYIQKGQLVPDEVTCKIVEIALNEINNENFMLDGFPRNINQAQVLDKLVKIDKVIDISVDLGALTERICGRRSCTACGNLTHVSRLGGKNTCEKCGGELIQRSDDKEETVKSRLAVYSEQTAPLIEYYKAQGKLVSVNGMGTPDEVFEEVKKVLG